MAKKDIKEIVKKEYGNIAKGYAPCCYGGSIGDASVSISKKIGYVDDDIAAVPDGSNLGLGCGNPVAMASLKEGEIVVDLGCGAGFDCFLAANKVGISGRVIGIDITPEMIKKARYNAKKANYSNVEFRLGEIENLPLPDNYVDVIISNCVINLSPDKEKVFKEAYRVLKPNGRFMISDIILLKELPDFIKESTEAYVGCISGAILKDDYLRAIEKAGFTNIVIIDLAPFSIDCMLNDPTALAILKKLNLQYKEIQEIISDTIASIKIRAGKSGFSSLYK